MNPTKPIVFFDGVCGLCNRFIDFLLKLDNKRDALNVAALQGTTAKKYIPIDTLENLNTVVILINGQLYYKSTGVLKLCSFLPWYYRWLKVFLILPKGFRDYVYDWVSKNRYKWFGKKETCRLPTPEERAKFMS
ncbi:MAG: thiol-disulfide oxidoreductase DCC family protein [Bacteroidia bacterium]